jgi:hypothetical protein
MVTELIEGVATAVLTGVGTGKKGCVVCGGAIIRDGAKHCMEHDTAVSTYTYPAELTLDEVMVAHEETKKEESKMASVKEKGSSFLASVKSIGGTAWASVKKGAAVVGTFIKKHAAKSAMALAAVTVAGTFTSGLAAAVAVGTAIYAGVALAYEFIKARKEKADKNRTEMVMGVLGDALKYGVLGATSLVLLSGVAVAVLANVFVYSYVGYSYMTYFIVA